MSKTSDGRLVISFGLVIGLRIVSRSCELLEIKQGAWRCKTFAGELYTIIGEEICRNVMQVKPMVEEMVCYVRRLRFGRGYCACKFVLAIRDDENVSISLRGLRKGSKEIHRDEFQVSGCWKTLKFAVMALRRIILCATLAFAKYAFYICSHLRLVKLESQRIVHATLRRVSCICWMVW